MGAPIEVFKSGVVRITTEVMQDDPAQLLSVASRW